MEPTAQQGDPGQDTLTLGPPWPSRPCWKLQPLPRAAASRPTAGLGSATSFFPPPQESGSAPGTSVTSAALRPSPSASSAPGPSVKITRRGRWCPLPWKAGSAARSTTLRPPCPPSTGARSSVNWNHRITEKKSKSKRAAKCPSFYLKGKKGEEKSRGRISARRDRCDAGSLGQQCRLSKAGAGSQPSLGVNSLVGLPKPVVGSAVFSSVGLGIPLWRVRFTWSFLALLLCSRAFAAGKKELSSLFKIRTERKESFLLMR